MPEKIVSKAGAIVLGDAHEGEVALLYRAEQKDWSFPKGHVEPGEDPVETLTREMKEELGLEVRILRVLPDLVYIHPNGHGVSTKMFLARSIDDSLARPEHEGDDIKWVPIGEVISALSHNNLKEYFETIIPLVVE